MNIDSSVQEAIQQVAKAKIAEAFGGDVLGKIVDEVMNHKDRNHYGREESETFFDKVVHDSVADVIRAEVRKIVAEDEAFKKKVRESVNTKVNDFTLSVLDAFDRDDWRANLNVTIERKDD